MDAVMICDIMHIYHSENYMNEQGALRCGNYLSYPKRQLKKRDDG